MMILNVGNYLKSIIKYKKEFEFLLKIDIIQKVSLIV